jgi:hypothetical protein
MCPCVERMLGSRRDLPLENLALRQQLAAYKARNRRPRINAADRAFWVVLHRLWERWRDSLVIVKPDTVVRWHHAGFQRYWPGSPVAVGALGDHPQGPRSAS